MGLPMIRVPGSLDIWAISAFWQNRHVKLHPMVAME
jgi:hypothetical protein